MKNAIVVFSCVLCAALAACVKGVRDEEVLANYHPSQKETLRGMLDTVKGFDSKAPLSIEADFIIDGAQRAKRFRMTGTLHYDRSARAMYVTFFDYIFRTSVLVFLADGNELRLYYPVDKKLFIESMKGIDLGDYGGPAMSMDIILALASGNIPLVSGYRVKQGLEENNGNGTMLFLENHRYYQTVSFRDGLPDKMLIINRENGERFEIYFKKRVNGSDVSYTTHMVLVASTTGLRIDLRLRNVRTNGPVAVKRARDMKLPPDVRIITRH
ncbi:MAG: hypothetical protein JW838_13690 [Spirochaetes bacterium]|nr:hypothetical protein [Spirochaetota bacterium]